MQRPIDVCRACQNRKMTMQQGIVCGLTDQKPTFVGTCPTYIHDAPEAKRLERQKAAAEETFDDAMVAQTPYIPSGNGTSGGGGGAKVVGGIIAIVIAVVWFVVGLAADYIFFYPFILVIIGIVAIARGASANNKSKSQMYGPRQPYQAPPQAYPPPQQQVPPPHYQAPHPGPPPAQAPSGPPPMNPGAMSQPPQGPPPPPPPAEPQDDSRWEPK